MYIETMPVHLRPSADTASDAILCGDPARALQLAQELLSEPRMSNHHRGLWGYFGTTAAGDPLTIQATGLGGPSAAVVIAELAGLGVERIVRLGTCLSGDDSQPLGGALLADPAIGNDGTTAAILGAPAELNGDPVLSARLQEAGLATGAVTSTDLYYGLGPEGIPAGELLDLQSAPTLASAGRYGIAAAATVIVAASPLGRLEDDPLEAAAMRLGRLVASALAGVGAAGSADVDRFADRPQVAADRVE